MPSAYGELINTVDAQLVVGPRGIGKTTLLKMLMPQALDKWSAPEAQAAREQICFTGVFVQADRIWSGQLEQLSGSVDTSADGLGQALGAAYGRRKRFASATFAYSAFAALAETAAYRCRPDGNDESFQWVAVTRRQEEALIGELAESFMAHKATSTFAGLASQMQHNLTIVTHIMKDASRSGISESELNDVMAHRLLNVHFHTAAVEFITRFNMLAGDHWARWVLLVDEFEFLPPAARAEVGESFQGTNARLSYKVSLAPYTGTIAFYGTEMNDWHTVRLTHRPADGFTKRLLTRQFEKLGTPERLLKGRGFERSGKDTFTRASRNSSEVRRLCEFDESFAAWLVKILDGRAPELLGEDDARLRKLRKAMPLVRLRLAHQEVVQTLEAGRSARVSPMYAGLKNIDLLCEGNPRWIKALAYELRKGRSKKQGSISELHQAEAISHVARVLYDSLRAVSVQQLGGESAASGESEELERTLTPVGVLTTLGDYLHIYTHERAFSPNVPGTFQVDARDSWSDDVLNTLIFLGALVVEPRNRLARYERVRIAHMYAPLFELLLTKGRARPISKVLSERQTPQHSLVREAKASAHDVGALDAVVVDA